MIISDLELFAIELPASGAAVRSLVVRVATQSGLEGWGETHLTWNAATLPARHKTLLNVLVGHEVFDIEAILALDALDEPTVACGIEMALWDLVARHARQPLCHLLGGAYRASVPLAVRLPSAPAEAMAQMARAFAAQGIFSQIVAGGGALEADLKLIATIREACGDRIQLRFDARGQYDARQAMQLVARLDDDSLQCLLDPLPTEQHDKLPLLKAAGGAKIGSCSGIASPGDCFRLAQSGAIDCAVIDPRRVGGLSRARQCAAIADAAELQTSLTIEGTAGVALAATLQLAAATPCLLSGHECSYAKLHDDILTEPLKVVDGMLSVPSGLGIGVEVDRDKLDWYQAAG